MRTLKIEIEIKDDKVIITEKEHNEMALLFKKYLENLSKRQMTEIQTLQTHIERLEVKKEQLDKKIMRILAIYNRTSKDIQKYKLEVL